MAVEINNVGTDRMLPAEFISQKGPVSEMVP